MNTRPASMLVLPFVRRTLAVVALGVVAFATVPAQASDPRIPAHVVKFADLDLSHPSGAERLYVRLASAAGAVCGHPDSRDYVATLRAKLCREQAIARAVADVKHPAFSSWYAARLGRASPPAQVAAVR